MGAVLAILPAAFVMLVVSTAMVALKDSARAWRSLKYGILAGLGGAACTWIGTAIYILVPSNSVSDTGAGLLLGLLPPFAGAVGYVIGGALGLLLPAAKKDPRRD